MQAVLQDSGAQVLGRYIHTPDTLRQGSSIIFVKPYAVRHSVTVVRTVSIPPHLNAELPTGQLKAQV